MPSYLEQHDIWAGEDLRKRLIIAVCKAASDISNEDPATANHADRVTWAKGVFADPYLKSIAMSGAVMQNAVIQTGTYTDSDLQFVVNGLVNLFSKL